MSLAAPWGLAALLLAAPLTLWYLLRSRRPAVVVPSTLLWRGTDRSVAAAVPWQRLRPDRTYWLVLAAIVAGALALARPTVAAPAQLGDHTIVVVDTSASMQADEGGPSRLELARRGARDLVDRMAGEQTVSVIDAGPRARIAVAATGDAGAARRAITGLASTGGAADVADAFTLAASLQRPGERTVTHLFTDGPVPPDAIAAVPAGLVVNGVGSDRPNLAVARLQPLPGGAGGAQAFVQVRNLGQLGTAATLTVTLDDREVARRDVDLGPRDTQDLIVDVGTAPAGAAGVLRASVTPRGTDAAGQDSGDALAIDDTAVAVLTGPRRVRALVVGPGNVYVESALAAVGGVEVRTAQTVPVDLTGVDLLVVDGVVAPIRPEVPTLYLAPRRPPADVTVSGTAELPAVTFQDPAAELLTDVDLSGVAIAEAQRVDAPTLQTLASGPSGPLLLAGRLRGTPVVYVPFSLSRSNLPVQVAWPVFAANTVSWLAGPPSAMPTVAGTTATVPVPAGATAVTAIPPAGDAVPVDPLRPQVRLDHPGLWEIRVEGPDDVVDEQAGTVLAVNADPDESDLARGRPAPVEQTGRRGEAAPPPAQDGRRSLVPWFLAAALAALVADALWPSRPLRRASAGRTSRRRAGRRAAGAPV